MNKPEVKSARVLNAEVAKPLRMSREELAKKIKRDRARDSELVTGIFKNLENPAIGGAKGSLVFPFKMYAGDQLSVYELWDGERYTLPRGVARHLNQNCFYREYRHIKGEFGNTGIRQATPDGKYITQNMQESRKIHRFAFHSLEYMDDDLDMVQSNVSEVSVVGQPL